MVRHIVTWNFKDGFTQEENLENAKKAKAELEGLKQHISGIIELQLHIDLLPSSNKAVVLDSLYESNEALEAYQRHPEHVRVAAYIGTVFQDRACVDYIIN